VAEFNLSFKVWGNMLAINMMEITQANQPKAYFGSNLWGITECQGHPHRIQSHASFGVSIQHFISLYNYYCYNYCNYKNNNNYYYYYKQFVANLTYRHMSENSVLRKSSLKISLFLKIWWRVLKVNITVNNIKVYSCMFVISTLNHNLHSLIKSN